MGLKEFFTSYKKEILTAAGLTAAGALFYLLFSRKDLEKQIQGKKGDETTTVEIPKKESDITVTYIEGTKIISKETLLAIHSLIAKQMSSKYLKKIIETRKDRRKYLKAIQPYIKECMKLQEALDQIINQITTKILLELKIAPDVYQSAYEYHAKKEGSDSFLDVVSVPDAENIPSEVTLSKQKVLEVYNFQFSILEDAVHEVVAAAHHDVAAQELDHLIEFRLLDLTAFNLGIEEEDLLNKNNFHFQSDPEIKALIQKKDNFKRVYITRFA